jgi:hypothetical protein
VGEVLLVDRVHFGEVVHGGDEDVDLQRKGGSVSKMQRVFSIMATLLLLCRQWDERRTLTVRLMLLPASSRMFLRASQQALVWSAMLPPTRLPWASAGIWPETQIWPAASMAWDWEYALDQKVIIDSAPRGCWCGMSDLRSEPRL